MKTIFCDIDGTLFHQTAEGFWKSKDIPIKSSVDKIREWYGCGYFIVFVTSRPKILQRELEQTLYEFRIPFHLLVTGLPSKGGRVLINDLGGSHSDPGTAARAIETKRNEGLGIVLL